MDLDRATDEELLDAARGLAPAEADRYLDVLYRRHYTAVARWCLSICGDREQAADLAQDVFLRLHTRLDSFRGDSRFSTWLYTVTRSVAINRGQAASRRRSRVVPLAEPPEMTDPAPQAGSTVLRDELRSEVRQAMRSELKPLEARVLYLHFVDGMTLPAIGEMLKLKNKSGAKAFVVSGMRKLRRRFPAHERRAMEML